MTKVQITPNKKTGALVNPYQSNPLYGYVQLQQTSRAIVNGWVREKKRSTLLRGTVEMLNSFVKENKSLTVPGKIVTQEFLESAVPADLVAAYMDNSKEQEEMIAPFIKRTGNDGVELTYGGERIIRFSIYDESGSLTDIYVAHDNVDAVREAVSTRAENQSAEF